MLYLLSFVIQKKKLPILQNVFTGYAFLFNFIWYQDIVTDKQLWFQEDKPWMALCEKISERCYILGDQVWHRPGLLKDEELTDSFRSSGVVYRLEQMNTVSDIIHCAKKMEG